VAGDGRMLTGFTKEDFRVFDHGKEQPIAHFSAGEVPLDLILLFDISGSMKPKVELVASAAREGMAELRPGDRVALMVFNTRVRTVLPFTENLDRVQRSIREDILGLNFGGGTFIQTGVSEAARRFLAEPRSNRRRAVLIITDNIGQRTRREETVVRELWEADALLTGLIVPAHAAFRVRAALSPTLMVMQVGVKRIAEKTGGDFIQSGDPASAFPESMRRIRSRYTLYYAMPEAKPGTRRTIRVELARAAAGRHPKAKVRARTGYLTPAAATSPDRP
jgi:VWFA-related protein